MSQPIGNPPSDLGGPVPVGVEFLDGPLGGGTHPGEVYGIFGFTGSGRTTLGAMIAAEGGARTWRLHDTTRRWCMVVTGQSAREVDHYAVSHIAKIPADDVYTEVRRLADLPDTRQQEMAGRLRQRPPKDHMERVFLANAVNGHAMLVVEGYPDRPPRTLSEPIVRALAANPRGLEGTGGLVIDGLDLYVEEFASVLGEPRKALPRLYRTLVSECRDLGRSYGFSVWFMHRIRAALATAPPDKLLHHKDSAECHSLGDVLDGCFTIGNRDKGGRFLLRCTKSPRRTDPETVVLRFAKDSRTIERDPSGVVVRERKYSVFCEDQIDPRTAELLQSFRREPLRRRPERQIDLGRAD